MKICFLCDLHLPRCKSALQYDVLQWALSDIRGKMPDCVAFVGDVTADGEEAAYDFFLERLRALPMSTLYIPGNSDLRSPDSRVSLFGKASMSKSTIGGVDIYAVNDADGTVSTETRSLLCEAGEGSIVFMHHPISSLQEESAHALRLWRKTHPATMLFYAHLHRFEREEHTVCLPALDPDKCIGEPPALVYYDTEARTLARSHYPVFVPKDIESFFGISVYRTEEQISFATERGLRFLELRPSCVRAERKSLLAEIESWRRQGGERLSVHLPDVGYRDGKVFFEEGYDEVLAVVAELRADRVTQHVPKVAVGEVERNPAVLSEICEAIVSRLNALPHSIVIGVENMHMTASERADENRRFGYTPVECLRFMEELRTVSRHQTGINFDIGHARNNAPYSQTYPIGTWLSMVGEHIVGYHLHQVTHEDGVFENHMPITHPYGALISYASFFKYWEMGRIAKAPLIFEMRPEGAYATTLATFERAREEKG